METAILIVGIMMVAAYLWIGTLGLILRAYEDKQLGSMVKTMEKMINDMMELMKDQL